jgi:hypothetical protein
MFGLFKNTAVNIAIGDLDRCIYFLTESGAVSDHPKLVSQIANTIHHWCAEIAQERADTKSVHNHFQQLKNKVLFEQNLKNHENAEFCGHYILMSFFFCLMTIEQSNAKIAANKILNMCETKCEKELRSAVVQILKPLRKMSTGG